MLKQFVVPDLYPAAPEIFLAVMACVLIFVDLLVGRTRRWITGMLAVATLACCAVITFATADGQTVLTFSNMFVDDLFGDFLELLLYATVITVPPSWGAASRSRSMTCKSGVPGTFWARPSRAIWPRWAASCTCSCWSRPSGSARARPPRTLPRTRRSGYPCPRTCPRTMCRTSSSAWPSTAECPAA